MVDDRKKVVILGGGLSGLVAGEILAKKYDVTILESAPFVGGLASTFEHDGKRIPNYYHHIIKSNRSTQRYLYRFGGVRPLRWKRIHVAIGVQRKIYSINTVFGLARFNYLSWYEKFRFGLFGAYTLFVMNPKRIQEGLDAQTWLSRYAGSDVTRKIFHHLYSRNKFNIPLNRISACQFANRLYEKEIYDYFSFPKESYQPMIDGIEQSIKANNGKVVVKSKITKINLQKKWVEHSGHKIKYDYLINSMPFEVFCSLATGIPEEYKNQILKVKYCPAVGLCFATDEFLDPNNYWINLFGERIHIIMQHSLLCNEYGEKISWCLRYGGSEEDLNLSEEEVKKTYLDVVTKYFPHAKIRWAKVMRTKYAEPIYDIDYHKYMPEYKTPIEGLYFTGIQLTYPKIRNMNVAIESGIKVAHEILKDRWARQIKRPSHD